MTPRSLADALRARDDAGLARLLRARPDLLHPVPSDFTALASRATTGPSVSRCLDTLSATDLFVLASAARMTAVDAVAAGAIAQAVCDAVADLPGGVVQESLDRLIDLGLLWGTDDVLRAIHPVRDALTDAPAPTWPAPELTWSTLGDPAVLDAQGGAHAHDTLTAVRELCDAWAATPPQVMRSGGLSVRDLAQAVRTLNTDIATTAIVIETAAAAGLIADDGEEDPAWVPTDLFDTWLGTDASHQWLQLATAWLTTPRLPSAATEKTNLLSQDLDRRAVIGLRHTVLALLAEAPVGAMVTADSIRAVLDVRHPRRAGRLRDEVIAATLIEAAALGVLVGGALTTAGRHLVAGEEKVARKAMEAALPAEIDHVLIQGDLTIVAPGPVVPEVARTLRLVADVESRGHATVYRVSSGSVERALDAGWDPQTIEQTLEGISTTGVPQPLAYLIHDTARRHGSVRVGIASSYIRCESEATIAAILGDRRLRGLALTRVGSDVLVSQSGSGDLIEALRASGYAPAAEAPNGSLVVRRPRERRAPAPRQRRAASTRTDPATLIAAAVRGLRSGERPPKPPADAQEGGAIAPTSSAATVAALRRAISQVEPIRIAYADADGTTTEQTVDPIRLGGGTLTAFDHRTEQVRTFAVSRISGVAQSGQ